MAFGWRREGGGVCRAPSNVGLAVLQGRRAGGGEVSAPSHSMLRSRYQLHSQEEAKERRHSHTIGGLPEADDQPELPSPPALPMALVGKGPLTSIGQCPPPPCAGLGPSVPRCPGSLLGHRPAPEPRVNVLLLFLARPALSIPFLLPHRGSGLWLGAKGFASGHLTHPRCPACSSAGAQWSPAVFLLGPVCPRKLGDSGRGIGTGSR